MTERFVIPDPTLFISGRGRLCDDRLVSCDRPVLLHQFRLSKPVIDAGQRIDAARASKHHWIAPRLPDEVLRAKTISLFVVNWEGMLSSAQMRALHIRLRRALTERGRFTHCNDPSMVDMAVVARVAPPPPDRHGQRMIRGVLEFYDRLQIEALPDNESPFPVWFEDIKAAPSLSLVARTRRFITKCALNKRLTTGEGSERI